MRHQSLTDQRDGLIAQRHELVTDNRLRQRVFDFAHRAAAGIDKLSFPQRQQLLRLVVDQVRVTGWQVEIQLRIPLDDNRDGPGGGDSRPPASDAGPDGSRLTHTSATRRLPRVKQRGFAIPSRFRFAPRKCSGAS